MIADIIRRKSAKPSGLPVSGATLWLDASVQTSLFKDAGVTNVSAQGDLIYQWNDLSGNNRNAIQATSGSRPTWNLPSNGQNSLSTVGFNGSQYLRSSYLSNPSTLFAAGKCTGTGNRAWAGNDSSNGGLRGTFYFKPNNPSNVAEFVLVKSDATFVSDGGPASITNSPLVHVAYFNGSTLYSLLNNGTASTASFGTGTRATPAVGTNIGASFYNRSTADLFLGQLYELILYDSLLSQSQITSNYNYLKSKWGTP